MAIFTITSYTHYQQQQQQDAALRILCKCQRQFVAMRQVTGVEVKQPDDLCQ